jgi:hypothetical protein
MTDNQRNLLWEIAQCPNVVSCFQAGNETHPCYPIVMSQEYGALNKIQVPEPWNGDLEKSPLLYLSSNPSISKTEVYPTWIYQEEEIMDFFINRFSRGKKIWVKDGKYGLKKNGSYTRATPYWSEMIKRSEELHGRNVEPGIDYVFTEIVHCKSKDMIGVKEALDECAGKFLNKILELSAAKVIAVIGEKPGKFIKDLLKVEKDTKIYGPKMLWGKERLVLFLAAPNSNKLRRIEKVFVQDEIELINRYL